MKETILLGSGWNPYLFRREISSLVDYHKFHHPRILSIDSDLSSSNLLKSALLDNILIGGMILKNIPSKFSEHDLSELLSSWSVDNLPEGTFAIRTKRIGIGLPQLSRKTIEIEIGSLLMSDKNSVDLENPDHEVIVIIAGLEDISNREKEFDNLEPIIVWGLCGNIENKKYDTRSPIDRPFFKPVSLDPRLARLMISLSHKPDYSPKTIIDPFCGTGGIAIEAYLQGMNILASDLDLEMVNGTIKNLEWANGNGNFKVQKCSVSEIPNIWGCKKDSSFVFDPPYGRNSWKSDDGLDLFLEALKSANYINPKGSICAMLPTIPEFTIENYSEKSLVMGKKWRDIELLISKNGWNVVFKYPIKVHRSLARLILVCHPSH